jgi:hypothetical protein
MKRIGNLYDKIWDMENIKLAHKNARKGKTKYKEVQKVDENLDYYLGEIQIMLRDKTFINGKYTVFTKMCSGKERTIFRLPYFPDRIIHHCIMQVLSPIWDKVLIRNTFSSIKGRGIHDGVKRIKKDLKDHKQLRYCLKFDIKKFYPSISNRRLKAIIRKKIKDPDVLWLLDLIIDSVTGIPIGNYLSQYLGNLYLTYFDHFAKEGLKCEHYYRYCDDIVILHNTKIFLHSIITKTKQFLLKKLELKVKRNWQVFPINSRGIDFLGYVIYTNYCKIRKSIKERFVKKINTLKKYDNIAYTDIVNSVMSFLGWFKFADTRNLIHIYVTGDIFTMLRKYGVSLRRLQYVA